MSPFIASRLLQRFRPGTAGRCSFTRLNRATVGTIMLTMIFSADVCRAQDSSTAGWNATGAAAYLDERLAAWFNFASANRGQGDNKTSCVCCHTLVPIAMARPPLRKALGVANPTAGEQTLLAQTKKRTANFANLDTPQFRFLYGDPRKEQSFGTEAVLNAVMLAYDDQYSAKTEPSEATRQALDNLWSKQITTGDKKGSWEWLNFELEPWESTKARYYGAALAAIAVGTAPGYYGPQPAAELEARVQSLREYLTANAAAESSYNRVWLLLASTNLNGLLDQAGRTAIINEIHGKRNADGGWSLSSLGMFTRKDTTPQATTSDGYATGLILHAFQSAGLEPDDAKVAPGIAWLKNQQQQSGRWPGNSLNYNRDPETFVGKFMSDAATAFAVLALTAHAEK